MSIGKNFKAVTPSDTVDLPKDASGNFPAALRFGSTGDASVLNLDGDTVSITGVTAGEQFPCSVKRVRSTGTDVTGIIAIYL